MEEKIIKRGPGRPTDKRKDAVLRLRIDSDTQKKLYKCAADMNVSMSELVRQAVDEVIKKSEEEKDK